LTARNAASVPAFCQAVVLRSSPHNLLTDGRDLEHSIDTHQVPCRDQSSADRSPFIDMAVEVASNDVVIIFKRAVVKKDQVNDRA
jgi:hypothetical protein